MESYKVSGLPSSGLQQGYAPHARARGQNSTYGLSIRVQGIDGHPYVILNNQDRGSDPYAGPSQNNGFADSEGSFIDNYREYDFRGARESISDNPFAEYRAINQKEHGGPHNGVSEPTKTEPNKNSALLNFQKHPEILKPYDPENNTLDSFRAAPPQALSETRGLHPGSLPRAAAMAVARSPSPDHPEVSYPPTQDERKQTRPRSIPETFPSKAQQQTQPLAKSQTQAPTMVKAQPQPRVKSSSLPQAAPQPPSQPAQRQPVPQASLASDHCLRRTSSSTSSANSSLERVRREPDVLPLHRSNSSGPALQFLRSRHSSTSSTTPTKEEQLEALYADSINRHDNRRYIPFMPGTGRDIDTGPIPGVDELISKFGGKENQPRRGRAGRRNRINPEDRKRSRSVDSALPFGLEGDADYLDEVSRHRGRSSERLLRPSQLLQKSPVSTPGPGPFGRWFRDTSSAPGSPQGTVSRTPVSTAAGKKPPSQPSVLPAEIKSPAMEMAAPGTKILTSVATAYLSRPASNCSHKKKSSEMDAEVRKTTPDLLKGQQELSQQTHEETAKQILFNYLRDGSNDSDDTTKRKVNLVFEKIQTLKSRAAGGSAGDSQSPDFTAQAKALQEQKAELDKEVSQLKSQLEEESKKQRGLTEAQVKASTRVKDLQKELELSQAECRTLRDKLAKTEADLRTTLEELFQVKMEREQYQTEIRDLQDQLSEMHDELDGAKHSQPDPEKKSMMEDLMQLKLDMQEVLLVKEEQEEVLRRRERELTALKGALKEEVSTHDQEVDMLKEEYEKELHTLRASVEEAKQSNASVCKGKVEAEVARGAAEGQVERLSQELERLRRRAQELEHEVAKLNRIIDEAKLQESRLGERASRLEKEKRQLEESLDEVREQEEEMTRANHALTSRLEDVQRNLSRTTQENREMEERLREERSQKEQFKSNKNEIEEERKLLDRTVEKLQREMSEIVEASQSSTQELQEQIDMYKERNRRELAELQRQLRDGGLEMEKCRLTTKSLQEELAQLEGDLRQCKKERDEAELRVKALEQKVFELEVEADTRILSNDKSKQMKLLEDRITQLELDLEEEKQSGDRLMDRVDRGREQVEQLRNELLQERASKQDLECDKIALDRQNKDLKSRIAHLESSQKSSKEGHMAQLQSRIQELEERLESEERDRANLQLVNRRLERKVKEMMMQMDEEHHSLQDQKDQLNLRLKALKRQMDEAEEEIDRLEHSKKKLQRELEEQQEANEELQNQLKALRNEMRRKSNSAPLLNNLGEDDDEDDISTDGETYFSSSSGYKRSSSQDAIMSTFSL
ncbi:cingulin-like protein 1 isoform X1 [Electrophorus electricus]|uniref:cingulin-like protein 1 isoform X1 n=1 Tax=Electrophorus electricus TaxID=8005 RepID=UPI0015D08861|nr:cingulin-like protein 1 isoform X1 [Electrophorus electricus]XP_035376764.1 cingulin-like protein 1 isoform X1 [Electrophorus electricus]